MDSTVKAARLIAEARTRTAREQRLRQIAPAFRELVGRTAAYMIAGQIAEIPGREARRRALEEVPPVLSQLVRELVVMHFQAQQALQAFEAEREPGTVVQ